MALVNALSYSLQDYSGDRRTVRVFAPATATLAEMQALSDVIAAELDAITGMQIVGASVSLALTLPGGIKGTPAAAVDAERGINWRFSSPTSSYSYTIRTPGALDANVDGEDYVATADGSDWITAMLDGDAVTEPTDQNGNDLASAVSQAVTFHK